MGKQAPRTSAPHDVEDGVEDLSEGIDRGRPVALGAGTWGSRQSHSASERSVGYVVLMHARVATPTLDYSFLDSFRRGILRSSRAGSCIDRTVISV
jgi:hypothetical protein